MDSEPLCTCRAPRLWCHPAQVVRPEARLALEVFLPQAIALGADGAGALGRWRRCRGRCTAGWRLRLACSVQLGHPGSILCRSLDRLGALL